MTNSFMDKCGRRVAEAASLLLKTVRSRRDLILSESREAIAMRWLDKANAELDSGDEAFSSWIRKNAPPKEALKIDARTSFPLASTTGMRLMPTSTEVLLRLGFRWATTEGAALALCTMRMFEAKSDGESRKETARRILRAFGEARERQGGPTRLRFEMSPMMLAGRMGQTEYDESAWFEGWPEAEKAFAEGRAAARRQMEAEALEAISGSPAPANKERRRI